MFAVAIRCSECPSSPPFVSWVLDVNGVLYDYDRQQRIEALADALGVPADAVGEAIFGSGLEDAADAGEIGPDEYLSRATQRLGVELDRPTWRRALAGAVRARQPVLDLLGRISPPTKMATLSNNGLLVKEEVASVYPEIAELGIEFHVAAELGDAKPDRDVYLDLCNVMDVRPEEAVFVDDKEANVAGAERAGLRAHRFTGVAALTDFLAEVGLDVV